MFSKTAKPIMRSAAWRISMWATLAFACGTMVVFIFLHQFVAGISSKGPTPGWRERPEFLAM